MKIAVNTRLLLEGKMDGIGWFTYETFKRICRNHPEHQFHFFFDRPYSEKFIFSENIIPHVIPPQARHPWLYRIWYDYSIPRILKKIGADIFISPDAMMSLRTDVLQLIVMHDLNFVHYPKDLKPLLSRYLNEGSKQYVRAANRIVTVSDFSKQDIIQQYGVPNEKVDVVYNGVNEEFHSIDENEKNAVREELTGGEPYFLFVGSAYPRKNLQRLLPAFDQFKKKTGSSTKLVVVGKRFSNYKEVEEVYSTMMNKHDVIFTGVLDSGRLGDVTAAARASVYVSYFEGFGIPILEAFTCNVPVITSNLTSMPEVAGEAAILVDPFSIDEISNALERIDRDKNLAQGLIEKGKKRLELFSWDKTAELLWKSIEKMF